VRITWPVLDRAPVTVPLEAPLLGDVEAFELRFYETSGRIGRFLAYGDERPRCSRHGRWKSRSP